MLNGTKKDAQIHAKFMLNGTKKDAQIHAKFSIGTRNSFLPLRAMSSLENGMKKDAK